MMYQNYEKATGWWYRWLWEWTGESRRRARANVLGAKPIIYPPWMEIRSYQGDAMKVWRIVDGWFGDYSGLYEPSDGTTNQRCIGFVNGAPAFGAIARRLDDWGNDVREECKADEAGHAVATFVFGPGESWNVNTQANPAPIRLMMTQWQGVTYPSDEVWGVVLPEKQHTQVWAVFELQDNAPQPPQPPSDGDWATVLADLNTASALMANAIAVARKH